MISATSGAIQIAFTPKSIGITKIASAFTTIPLLIAIMSAVSVKNKNTNRRPCNKYSLRVRRNFNGGNIMVANSDLERQLKEALDEVQAQLDDLENTIREIEHKIDESISQLKSLKSDI